MTMLMHTRGTPLHREAGRLSERLRLPSHSATIKQFCGCALTILIAGGAIAGIIALKTAVYFWRFNY